MCFQAETFQKDLYPPCISSTPALSAEEWFSGILTKRESLLISRKKNIFFIFFKNDSLLISEKNLLPR